MEDSCGLVYVMHLLDPNAEDVYKIGHCSENKVRLHEFTKLPYDVEYTFMFQSPNRKIHEKILHQKYSTKRLNGEWFRLTKYDLKEIKEYLEKDGCKIISGIFEDCSNILVERKRISSSCNICGEDIIHVVEVNQCCEVNYLGYDSFKYINYRVKDCNEVIPDYCETCGGDEFLLKDVYNNYSGNIVCANCGKLVIKGRKNTINDYFSPHYNGKFKIDNGKCLVGRYYPELMIDSEYMKQQKFDINLGKTIYLPQKFFGYTKDECLEAIKGACNKNVEYIEERLKPYYFFMDGMATYNKLINKVDIMKRVS